MLGLKDAIAYHAMLLARLKTSPDLILVAILSQIDFKYLEKCIAFLVQSEKDHSQRIQKLEEVLVAEQGHVQALTNELAGLQQTCAQVEDAAAKMRDQLASSISCQESQTAEVKSLQTNFDELVRTREQERRQDAAERERSEASSSRQERQLEHTATLAASLAGELEAMIKRTDVMAGRLDSMHAATQRLEEQQTQAGAALDEFAQDGRKKEEEAAEKAESVQAKLSALEATLGEGLLPVRRLPTREATSR